MTNPNKLPVLEEQADAYVQSDLLAKPEIPEHTFRTNSRGFVEAVCSNTGRVLAVQASVYDLLETKWDRLVRINTPQGPVYLERGINPDIIPELQAMPYSKLLADLVCEKIVNGKTMKAALKELNLDYSTVMAWKRNVEEFAINLAQAKKDRTEVFYDEIVETSRERVSGKDKISALQWAAEKGNPSEFGTKKTGEGGGGTTIQIISVNTGIKRPGDPGYEAPAQVGLQAPQQSIVTIGQAETIEVPE